MTVRGENVPVFQVLISTISGLTLIIVGVVAYFMKDSNEQMRDLGKKMERVTAQVEDQAKNDERVQSDLDDIRNVLYNHITTDRN